eukprot:TRINITY_DN7919_c0_g1_i1.p1 TRINITY_DN7919_c0_g1~~TRINITY_DN7919_c0_g1_i1.p1  ORF type:complete len:278 (+),score=41.52 TRINITY_DN7919_c0_g1_i1:121-954(+)
MCIRDRVSTQSTGTKHAIMVARSLLLTSLLCCGLASSVWAASYEFEVCSGAGGAHGVDFRSHVGVYTAQHSLQGWVRNACNNCVYGQFSGEDALELSQILASPARVIAELASKASNISTTVTAIPSYPSAGCPVPSQYQQPIAKVDWSYATNCSSACSCRPVAYTDCQQTSPLPPGVSYTKDCQRTPLGNSSKNFADCNSVHMDAAGTSCFNVSAGEIVSSGACAADWASVSYAATTCCTGSDPSLPFTRQGVGIPPAPLDCAAYPTDQAYVDKCAN